MSGEPGLSDDIGPSLLASICTQIERLGDRLDADTLSLWRSAVADRNVTSPPAMGCLLAMVREAWARGDIWVRRLPDPGLQDWEVCMGARGLALGVTEAETLVAALEAALTDACSLCFDEGGAFGPCRQCHREAGGDIAPACEAPGCPEPATGTADIGGATVWVCGTVCLDSLVAALDDAPGTTRQRGG